MKKISYRVMKTDEGKDSVVYQISCDCNDPECNTILEFEIDQDIPMIFLNMYRDLKWSSYWGIRDNWYSWFSEKWKRIQCAIRVLFTGYIKVEESFVLQGEEHIDNIILALQEGKEILQNKLKE